MTVTATNTFSQLLGNGSATAFPFTFAAASATEVDVYLNGVRQTGGYTTSLNASGTGGTVLFDAAPANGVAVLLASAPAFTQASAFENNAAFRPDVFNRIHDRLAVYSLWLRDRVRLFFPSGPLLPSARAGKFLAFDTLGDPTFASGTGADSALRTDLAGATGSSLAGYSDTDGGAATTVLAKLRSLLGSTGAAQIGYLAAGGLARTVQARLRDSAFNARDYGAIGDGFNHPLSERFATLAAAQAAFPRTHAKGLITALTQSLDWAGIQEALYTAAATVNTRGTAFLPLGYYILSNSLRWPNFVTLEGVSRHGSVLLNQGTPLNAPQLVNDDPASMINGTVRNMAFVGGTHAIKLDCSSEIAGLTLDSISTNLQTESCFLANKQVQSSLFANCTFDAANAATHCWRSSGGANNNNVFIRCDFLNATGAHLWVDTGTGNHLMGCRFEGGGTATNGKRTIQLNAITGLVFHGCYFENTHEYLMEAATSGPEIRFDGCEFIGPVTGGDFQGYKWIANDTVTFGTNMFFRPTTGPANALQTGVNANLTVPITSVASAASIALPRGQRLVRITGTTAITSIVSSGPDTGREVTLLFADALTLTDGSNLKLNGNFVTTADDTIKLVCTGTDWVEVSRSAN